MSRDNFTDAEVYRACISWNLPALRKSGRDDVQHFTRTIQLLPSALDPSQDAPPTRMSPLRRAAEGLKAELTGDVEAAQEHYELVAKKQGVRGVLGCLLLAWMSDATENDFVRAERKLSNLSGPGMRDLVARGHCKLATWSLDQGWTERSRHHFDQGLRHAGKNLRQSLDGIGHWFGSDQVMYFSRSNDDMTTFPWIVDWVDQAAQRSVEDRFRESFKSPWSRTWSFGSPTVEGLDIQSAEMQASWAGALWMLPRIQRQHAALIMAKSNEPDDVARGIALWAKGGGQATNQLVSAKEAVLTEPVIEDLLAHQLHEGRSVRDRETWLDICHSLWAEMPNRLAEKFVRDFPGPAPNLRLHGSGTKELSLFGKLLVRSPMAVERAYGFDDWQTGLLARTLHPQLLDALPAPLLAKLLEAGLSDVVVSDEDWGQTGWASLVTCWTLLDKPAQAEHRAQLLKAIPASAIPEAALTASDLVPRDRIEKGLKASVDLLARDLRDASAGTFTGWVTHPAIDVARLALATGHVSGDVITNLVRIVTAKSTNPEQRRSCLSALESLAKAGLVQRHQVEDAFVPVAVNSVMSDDAATEQRLEDISRLALMVQFGYDQSTSEGPLLAASRDRDTQVRLRAVSAVCQLSMHGQSSPSFDATLLGALYDPHPRVQAEAIPALWRGRFESETLREVAQARVVEIWPSAHRDLRATIARETALADPGDPRIRALKHGAVSDRSWIVRRAAAADH